LPFRHTAFALIYFVRSYQSLTNLISKIFSDQPMRCNILFYLDGCIQMINNLMLWWAFLRD